jgi:hypothetical protein
VDFTRWRDAGQELSQDAFKAGEGHSSVGLNLILSEDTADAINFTGKT